MTTDLAEFEHVAELDELKRINRNLEQRLRTAKARSADLVAAVYQAARDAALIQGQPPAVPKPKLERGSKRAESAMLLLSDWHVGKRTGSFNSDVAAQRIDRLAEKVAKITEIERADHPVRECHALIAGDMIDGLMIYPGHAFEVDATLFEQLFKCANILEQLIRRLLAVYPVVCVWEAAGNHTRIGRKGDFPRTDNLDLLLYKLVRERFKGTERPGRLRWTPASSWHQFVTIGGYTALLIHGDQIKSFGGNVPSYGIARKSNAWASGVLGQSFTDVLMGHFHQPLSVPLANGKGRAMVNPSIESDSAYAQEFVAATGTPGQRLFFVDPSKGRITNERILWLDD